MTLRYNVSFISDEQPVVLGDRYMFEEDDETEPSTPSA
jgi:hypothetical protein